MRGDLEEQLRGVGQFLDDDEAVAWDRGDDSGLFIDVGPAPAPRWRALSAVAAVLVLVGVASVVWVRSGQGSAVSSSVTMPPDWRRVDGVTGFDALPPSVPATERGPVDVVWVDGAWVAVGDTARGGVTSGAVWRSGDGRRWDRVDSDAFAGDVVNGEPRSVTLRGVAGRGGVVIAVGVQSDGRDDAPFVVRSTDGGRRWERVRLPETSVDGEDWSLTAVAAGPVGFVIAGVGDAGVASWVSVDGDDWSFSFVDDPGSNTTSATVTDAGFIVGGSVDDRFAAVWSSEDGLAWQRSPLPETSDDPMYSSEVSRVISNGDTAVALVSRRSLMAGVIVDSSGEITITGPSRLEAWHSEDGTNWIPSNGPSVTPSLLNSAVETAPGRIVLNSGIPAQASKSGFIALVWTVRSNRIELVEVYSSDGINWASRPASQAETSPLAISPGPGGLLWLGQTGNPYTRQAAETPLEAVIWTTA